MRYTLRGYGIADPNGRVDFCEKDHPGVQLWRRKRDAEYLREYDDTVVKVKLTVEVEE